MVEGESLAQPELIGAPIRAFRPGFPQGGGHGGPGRGRGAPSHQAMEIIDQHGEKF